MSSRKDPGLLFTHDKKIREKYPAVCGIDEAGRGPLAGPVVAAAVILPAGIIIEGLRDSKQVSENKRLRLFWAIVSSCQNIGIGIVDENTIDSTNILRATKLAMKLAVSDLTRLPDILLIDAVSLPEINIRQRSITKGESISASIAAASIIAKTVRDHIMTAYHDQYPAYNFKEHKGYSTKAHMALIRQHGPCPIHRKSFKKVKEVELPFK